MPNSYSAVVNLSASKLLANVGETVTLTLTLFNDGDLDIDNVSVNLDGDDSNANTSDLDEVMDADSANFSGDANSDEILNPGETWSWTIDTMVEGNTTYTATWSDTDPQSNPVSSEDSVDVDAPLVVEVSNSPAQGTSGETLDVTIEMSNNGDDSLTNASVALTIQSETVQVLTLDSNSAEFQSGDTNSNGELDADETWTWGFQTNTWATYNALGSAEHPLGTASSFDSLNILKIVVGSAEGEVGEKVPVPVMITNARTGVSGFGFRLDLDNAPVGGVAAEDDVMLPDYSVTFEDEQGATVTFELTNVAPLPGPDFPASDGVRIGVADLSGALSSSSGVQEMVSAVCVTLEQEGSSALSLTLNSMDDDQPGGISLITTTLRESGTLAVHATGSGNAFGPNACP